MGVTADDVTAHDVAVNDNDRVRVSLTVTSLAIIISLA